MSEIVSNDGNQETSTVETSSAEPKNLSPGSQIKQVADLIAKGQGNEVDIDADNDPGNASVQEAPREGIGEPENAEDPAFEGGDNLDPDPVSDPVDAPQSIEEKIKELGISKKEMYSIEIPLSDGETITLGELKDGYRDQQAFVAENAERETSLADREASVIRAQQEISTLQGELAGVLTPERMQQIQERNEINLNNERRAMRNAFPEFDDESTFKAWRDDAVVFMGEYGFMPHEVSIGDHRLVAMLKGYMSLKSRMEKLSKFVPDPKPLPGKVAKRRGRGQTGKSQLVAKAKTTGKKQDVVKAISSLL